MHINAINGMFYTLLEFFSEPSCGNSYNSTIKIITYSIPVVQVWEPTGATYDAVF